MALEYSSYIAIAQAEQVGLKKAEASHQIGT